MHADSLSQLLRNYLREARQVSDEEILDRILYAMVNEGAKILDEGIAARSSDIDVIWITGYGWPRYRGGPMFWADLQGLPNVLGRLEELEAAQDRESPLRIADELLPMR